MVEPSEVQKVRDAAHAMQLINVVAAFAALCWVVFVSTENGSSPGLTHTIAGLGIFATPLLLAFGAYRLSRHIDAGPPVVWLIGSLLGCIGILVVLRLCHNATQWFRMKGLKVGLLGPTPNSLAAFERAQAVQRG